jgi:hypothetical protein
MAASAAARPGLGPKLARHYGDVCAAWPGPAQLPIVYSEVQARAGGSSAMRCGPALGDPGAAETRAPGPPARSRAWGPSPP